MKKFSFSDLPPEIQGISVGAFTLGIIVGGVGVALIILLFS